MRRSNCLFYAIRKFATEGGSIVVVKSKWGWWYHFQWWSPDRTTICEFAPRDHKRHHWCPPLWFVGAERCVPVRQAA